MERHKLSGLSFLTSIWPLDLSKPTLFFIHAAGASATSWLFQMDAANVLAVDLPGHGKSRSPGCSRIADYAMDLMDFINKINVNRCIPVGISMGGAIALELLIDYPGRFRAGILLSTGAKLRVLPDFFDAIKANPKGFMANLINYVLPANIDSERFESVIDDILEVKKDILLGDFTACNGFDIRGRLSEIDMPVLIISAQNDTMTPLWYGEYLKKNIKNSDQVIIQDSGHLVMLERSVEVNQAITEFLSKLDN
jgi:pimeloyl-ACP methyl ester carboxylesterase